MSFIAQIEAPCRECKRTTSHGVRIEDVEDVVDRDEDGTYNGLLEQRYWQIISCLGCHAWAFRTYHTDPGHDDPFCSGIWGEKIYPPPGILNHELKSIRQVPADVFRAYREVITAYNAGLYTLAAMGVRMVIEGICHTSGIPGTLHQQLAVLQEQGLLSGAHVKILQELRKHGNEAAHELFTPSREQMKLYLKVLETTLEVFYEFGELHKLMELERLKRKAERN